MVGGPGLVGDDEGDMKGGPVEGLAADMNAVG